MDQTKADKGSASRARLVKDESSVTIRQERDDLLIALARFHLFADLAAMSAARPTGESARVWFWHWRQRSSCESFASRASITGSPLTFFLLHLRDRRQWRQAEQEQNCETETSHLVVHFADSLELRGDLLVPNVRVTRPTCLSRTVPLLSMIYVSGAP